MGREWFESASVWGFALWDVDRFEVVLGKGVGEIWLVPSKLLLVDCELDGWFFVHKLILNRDYILLKIIIPVESFGMRFRAYSITLLLTL